MKIPHLLGAAAAALTLSTGALIAPAMAAPANDQQTDAAAWLADQVPSGTHLFESRYDAGPDDKFVDYGLNLDLQNALRSLGHTTLANQVYNAVIANSAEYTDSWGTRYAGSIGKLATYIELKGDDSTNVSGRDLIADLTALMDGNGRFLNNPAGYENNIGQSWGVRALALSGDSAVTDAANFLAGEQCSDGGFRETPAGTCTSSVDATAFAAIALTDAPGHSADVADAVAWLKSKQAANGSLSDAGNPNSNSTGIATLVFAANGETAAAEKAAGWISGLQLTAGPDAGAIASTPADRSAQGSKAIDALDQDKWVRATFQAALALGSLADNTPVQPGPVDTMTLKVSSSKPKQGQTITVTARGKDADGRSTGDVSDDIELASSVDTDTIKGNRVTFNHASPHTITATHVPTGTTASITVEVTPAAAAGGDSGAGQGSNTAAGALPDAGSPVQPWLLGAAGALVLMGVGLVLAGRARRVAA